MNKKVSELNGIGRTLSSKAGANICLKPSKALRASSSRLSLPVLGSLASGLSHSLDSEQSVSLSS